jgi:carbohydrate kinase (thermoresistant glucokinase family)
MSSLRIVVMGVAACGKSSVAAELANQLGARFVEGDEHHLAASVEKMSNGIPLTDDDRWPWLALLERELRGEIHGGEAIGGVPVVLSCSVLRKSYRDALRRAGNVRFVFLDVPRELVEERIAARPRHFMGSSMVESQFATLERPDPQAEGDVHVVDASGSFDEVAAHALAAITGDKPLPTQQPLLVDGGPTRVISTDELRAHIDAIVDQQIAPTTARRILLVPPDHTRLYSRAGEITALLFERLERDGYEVGVLPALGTHTEMTPEDVHLLFGDAIPYARILHHRWKTDLVRLGEIGAAEIEVLSRGRITEPIPVEVDAQLLNNWDLVISVGQVVPHEVIGMANFTKNIVIGLGGAPTVHRSHFLGAVSDMETLMGRADGPVRHVVDAAFDRFIAPKVKVLWVLTVMEDTAGGVVQRGLFVGSGKSSETGGAAYRAAAALSVQCNVDVVDREFTRVACWLDPNEFRTTWLGNKAIYRTRMAIADHGELIVLAPGVTHFGEDQAIDVLIRHHGYHGTPATLAALHTDADIAASLGAAAHLIHGSSEGRFTITYCTDPTTGGLSREEVEGVGFGWRSLPEELAHLGINPTSTAGPQLDCDGIPFDYIANPALGLWATPTRFR